MRISITLLSTVPILEITRMPTKEFRYKESARRKPVNVTVNQDLLVSAREYNLNLSKILEDSLITELKLRWQDKWLKENKTAIAAYNKHITKHGVFSDGIRRF